METLKKSKKFRRVYSSGKSKATFCLVIYWLENELTKNRFGFSISKKIGNAVVRNKLRRRMKEIIRSKEEKIINGYDIIFIARKPVTGLDFKQIEKNMIKLFKKAGIWRQKG